jgi:uncharacterized protein YndB with AHSA1/START domain
MASAFQPGLSGTAKDPGGEATLALLRPSLTIKRRFKASPEKLYAAWTDPEKVGHWFGCAGASVIDASFDVRVGGSYTIVIRKANGEESRVSGVYRDVIPNRKLVFTWTPEWRLEAESLVTLLITPAESGSYLTLIHEKFVDEETREATENGWGSCLDRLDLYLAA